MDLVMLSRLQFAVAVFFHFIFVPLTLGPTVLLAIMETIYVRTGDETYKRMAKFWGKLFLINFALGVVTGITLEFQFGTNWSKYSAYVGDIFGFQRIHEGVYSATAIDEFPWQPEIFEDFMNWLKTDEKAEPYRHLTWEKERQLIIERRDLEHERYNLDSCRLDLCDV